MTMRLPIVFACLLATVVAAAAQEHPPAAVDPKACAPGERALQGSPPLRGTPSTTGENLSDKLARTDGVICPPSVDPEIKAPTPDAGKMPVLPPPGSPGGDQSVQPK
jgi:hypothetical protein